MRLSLRLVGALALAATLFSPPLLAARPTLAVLPFSIERQVLVSDGRHVLLGTVEDQTSRLGDELIHQLVATRKFDVLERARLDDLLKEKDFQDSDYATPEAAPRLGRLLGADYFVLGRIEQLEARSEEKPLPYGTRPQVQQQARIALYLRVVDARSGRIVAAEKFASEARLRDPRPGDSAGRRLLTQAAQEMVGRIVNTVFPLRVAKVDGRTLYLNRGADGTLQVGDTVAVYREGEAIRDQDNGEVLGATESEVARATVTAVEARLSKAELSAEAAVQEGMRVKKLPAATAPAELPPGPRW